MMKAARRKLLVIGVFSMILSSMPVSAASVLVTQTCNVLVTFTATVPDSIEQGKSFTVSGISVSPSRSYGFNVTSSVFQMSATNTSSTSYSQNFLSTNPSPTTGRNSYVAYYPNWIINATGPVGGAVTIKLVKSITTIPGYGGSPVTCVYTKTLATVPIVAAQQSSPSPTPSPSPSPTSVPTPSSSPSSPSSPSLTPSASVSPIPSSTPKAVPSPSKSVAPQQTSQPESLPTQPNGPASNGAVNLSVSVVPLNVETIDSLGKVIKDATVTLDGSQKLTTDSKGRGVFSNVLTGKHTLLVSYKGQTVSREVDLGIDDIGAVVSIQLPNTTQPLLVGLLVTGGILTLAASLGFIVYIRRKHLADATSIAPSAAIPGVIAGSVGVSPVSTTLKPVPPIVVFEPQVDTPNPAPWDLSRAVYESVAQTPPQTIASQQPIQQSANTLSQPQVTTSVNHESMPGASNTVATVVQPSTPSPSSNTPVSL